MLVLANWGALRCISDNRRVRVLSFVVVFDEIFESAMTPRGVEVIVLHLFVDLIEIPAVELIPIDSAHRARAMPSSRSMHKEFARVRIANGLEKLLRCFGRWILFVNHRDVDVMHT